MDCESENASDCELFSLSARQISVPLIIQGHPIDFQLDTGCAISLVPQSVHEKFSNGVPLTDTSTVLVTYTEQKVVPLGQCTVTVTYQDTEYELPLLAVETGMVPLFGRNWLKSIKLDWSHIQVNYIRPLISNARPVHPSLVHDADSLLEQHSQLFDSGLGCYSGPPVELNVEKL